MEIDVSFFSSSYLDVSVQRVGPSYDVLGLLPNGLSHSDISGSNPVCKSPELFAAYHVFRRLQEPRHPPYALNYFLTTLIYTLLHIYEHYLISLNMSMNFANLLFATHNIEVLLLIMLHKRCCFFEEAEQLSITFK